MTYGYNHTAFFISLLIFMSAIACRSQHQDQYPEASGMPFKINQPDSTFYLPFELIEVSGLSVYDQTLYAVQDEMGVLYQLNDQFKIKNRLQFEGPGDFEALTRDDNNFYTITSKGHIYCIPILGVDAVRIKAELPKTCDFEGMYYADSSLYIISKGRCDDKEFDTKNRCIFEVNLRNGKTKLNREHKYSSIKKKLKVEDDHFEYCGIKRQFEKPKPSGMAVDPIDGSIYIIHARGRLLVKTDSEGEIQDLLILNPKFYPQAEGIAFDEKGNLFISNEGQNSAAMLHKVMRLTEN